MDFAQLLKRLMDEKGITNYQLSKDLDVHPTTVANWLSGKEPRKKTKLQLAGYFGADFVDLYPDVPPTAKAIASGYLKAWPDKEEQEKTPGTEAGRELGFDDFDYALHNESRELSEEKKQMLLNMARFMRQEEEKGK